MRLYVHIDTAGGGHAQLPDAVLRRCVRDDLLHYRARPQYVCSQQVCVCVCMITHTHIRMCICLCICVYVCLRMCTCTCMYVFEYVYAYTYKCLWMYSMYLYTFVILCLCMYKYTHTSVRACTRTHIYVFVHLHVWCFDVAYTWRCCAYTSMHSTFIWLRICAICIVHTYVLRICDGVAHIHLCILRSYDYAYVHAICIAHTCVSIRENTNTNMHTYMHTYTHARVRTHTYIQSVRSTVFHTLDQLVWPDYRRFLSAQCCAWGMHKYTHTHIHTYTHMRLNYECTCAHTYIRLYI